LLDLQLHLCVAEAMPIATDKFVAAVTLLRGTTANFACCILSMAASIISGLVAIYFMTLDADGVWSLTSKPVLAGQSMFFLITQSFTLAKVSRDFLAIKEGNVGRPSNAYYYQVLIFWVIALVSSLYSVSTISGAKEWASFYALDLVWITVSTVCLARAVRDQSEADTFEGIDTSQREGALEMMEPIIRGTFMYKVFVWLAGVGSTIMVLALVWSWPAESMPTERKLIVTVGDLWCLFSVFHFAKLVRDKKNEQKEKALRKQVPFQVMVWASMLGSAGTVFGAAIAMPLDLPQKFFIIAGSFFMVFAAFFLAKAVRDAQELDELVSGGSGPDEERDTSEL